MTKFTESTIEDFAIQLFERLGYSYVYAPDIALTRLAPALLGVNGETGEGVLGHGENLGRGRHDEISKLSITQTQILEKLRDTLLPKLMSGEVRVKL